MLKLLFISGCLLTFKVNPIRGDPCDEDGEYYNTSYGDIYSPGYLESKNYPNDVQCKYTINNVAREGIRLHFEHLDIEVSDFCSYDILSITSSISWISTNFCGTDLPKDIITYGTEVTISFQSDSFINKRGFHISFASTSETSLCKTGELECKNRNCVPSNSTCNGVDDCGDGTDEERCGYPIPPITECGIPEIEKQPDDGDRILGGQPAVHGSWPWQADLQSELYNPNGHICGGTLINAQWILTASHCLMNQERTYLRVILGNHDKFVKENSEQVRYVERFIVYPGFTDEDEFPNNITSLLENDIALIKLSAPVQFTKYVKPACLPKEDEELDLGRVCYATGWGETRGTGNNNVLKQMRGQILSERNCTRQSILRFLNETMVCYGHMPGGHGLCSGDSGGPLVCEKNKVWTVYGATSRVTDYSVLHNSCAIENRPTVYSRASTKITWIKEIVNKY